MTWQDPQWDEQPTESVAQRRILLLRQWINERPKLIYGVAAGTGILFLVVLIILLKPPTNRPSVQMVWFYDLNRQSLFAAPDDQLPPIKAPSQGKKETELKGVRAYAFYYNDQEDKTKEFVGYLENYTKEARQAHEKLTSAQGNERAVLLGRINEGRLVRRLEDAEWVAAHSPKGLKVMREAMKPNEDGILPRPWPVSEK